MPHMRQEDTVAPSARRALPGAVGRTVIAAWCVFFFVSSGAALAERLEAEKPKTYDTSSGVVRLRLGPKGAPIVCVKRNYGFLGLGRLFGKYKIQIEHEGNRRNRIELRDDQTTTIGRTAGATQGWGLPISVSRNHAAVTRKGDAVVVADLGSKNGTSVQGRRRILGVSCGSATEQGGREKQQDVVMVPFGVPGDYHAYLVVDGMGGEMHGEKAAARVASTVMTKLPELVVGKRPRRSGTMLAALGRALELADVAVCADAKRAYKIHDGRGATVAGCVIDAKEQELHVGNVGDVRAYLLRGGELMQLTRDHTLVERKRRRGEPIKDEDRGVVTRAVGYNNAADLKTHTVASGDRILLCSDGVHGELSTDSIRKILGGAKSAQQIAKEIVDAAGPNTGDNATAQVIFVK